MWILLNNQPVCFFNIKKVSGIIALTPELFYMDNNDIRKESVLSHIYSSLYPSEEYAAQIRDSLLQTINKITAELPKITI